jgi:tetratricopeptide (TPR) repeat protein
MAETAPRKICFMIMPYGRKPTGVDSGRGPTVVDFDVLWDRVLCPLIEEDLGFEAIRADQDLGPLILQEMIERLALSDVVIADVTAPNANVYYEVGVRHAAHQAGCVLIAAEWAQPAFDIAQMRRVTYPLGSGEVTEDEAPAIRAALRSRIEDLVHGPSVVFELLPGFPANVDIERTAAFRKRIAELSSILAEVSAARRVPPGQRKARALAVRERFSEAAANVPAVALEILALLRDAEAWSAVMELIESLPEDARNFPFVREQHNLARSKSGDHEAAIGALEELIRSTGDSSERRGLLGGRYKKRAAEAADPVDRRFFLDRAIDEYERGMRLDLNDYYPSSNLPRLLRERNEDGDEGRAQVAATVTVLACQRALERDPTDAWVRPTLLGAAFDAGDVDTARRLAGEIRRNGAAPFHLNTTIVDLERSVALQKDGERASALRTILDDLRRLVPDNSG